MPLYNPPSIPGLTTSGGVVTIATESTSNLLVLESTTDGGATDANPELVFKSASDDNGDYIGSILFQGKNAGGTYDTYAQMFSRIDTTTESQTAGGLFFTIKHQNANKTWLWMEGHPTGTGTFTINYNAANVLTSIFTGTSTVRIYQDGTAKTLNSGLRLYQRTEAADMDGTGVSFDFMLRETTGSSDKTAGRIGIIAEQDWTSTASTQDASMVFYTIGDGSSTEKMRLTSAGNFGIGTTNPSELLHLSDADGGEPAILIENTGTASGEPEIIFFRSTTSPASSMDIGHIKWKGRDDGGNIHNYASIFADMLDETGGTEDGRILFNVARAGTDLVEYMRMGGTELTINDSSKDIDFRVESDNETHALFVRGSDGNVGIGTSTPAAPLHITVTGEDEVLRLESTDAGGNVAPVMTFKRTSATPVDGDNIGIIQFLAMNSDQDDGAGTEAEHKFADMYARINDITTGSEDGEIYFRTLHGGTLKRRLDMNALGVVFNEESLDMNFRVESNGNANMLVVDGGTDKVGIGVLAPTATLDVVGDVRFRASVEVCTSDPAPATTESGTVYQFTKGSAGVFTLPADPPVGTQFVLVNGDGQDIVITRPHSSVKINGATSNATNTTAYAATSIVAVVQNGNSSEWLAFGGI